MKYKASKLLRFRLRKFNGFVVGALVRPRHFTFQVFFGRHVFENAYGVSFRTRFGGTPAGKHSTLGLSLSRELCFGLALGLEYTCHDMECYLGPAIFIAYYADPRSKPYSVGYINEKAQNELRRQR